MLHNEPENGLFGISPEASFGALGSGVNFPVASLVSRVPAAAGSGETRASSGQRASEPVLRD